MRSNPSTAKPAQGQQTQGIVPNMTLPKAFAVNFIRSLVGSFLAALLALCPLRCPAEAIKAEDLLIGTWRHESLTREIDGETAVPQAAEKDTLLEYKRNGTWILTTPYNRSEGTYRWLKSGELETRTLESGLIIQVGTMSVKQVLVDQKKLTVITRQTREEMDKFMAPAKPGIQRRPNLVVLTSVFSRVAPK